MNLNLVELYLNFVASQPQSAWIGKQQRNNRETTGFI